MRERVATDENEAASGSTDKSILNASMEGQSIEPLEHLVNERV